MAATATRMGRISGSSTTTCAPRRPICSTCGMRALSGSRSPARCCCCAARTRGHPTPKRTGAPPRFATIGWSTSPRRAIGCTTTSCKFFYVPCASSWPSLASSVPAALQITLGVAQIVFVPLQRLVMLGGIRGRELVAIEADAVLDLRALLTLLFAPFVVAPLASPPVVRALFLGPAPFVATDFHVVFGVAQIVLVPL